MIHDVVRSNHARVQLNTDDSIKGTGKVLGFFSEGQTNAYTVSTNQQCGNHHSLTHTRFTHIPKHKRPLLPVPHSEALLHHLHTDSSKILWRVMTCIHILTRLTHTVLHNVIWASRGGSDCCCYCTLQQRLV